MDTFYKIYILTLKNQKSKVLILICAMFGMALFQTIGIASILPFISVLSNPDIIFTNKYLIGFYDLMNFDNENSFLLSMGIITLIVLLVSNLVSAYATKSLINFASFQGHSLSEKLFHQYVRQPYIFFLNKNSSDLVKNVITDVHRLVMGAFTPALDIISRTMITLFIIALLVAMDPFLAFLVLFVCGGSYLFVYKITKRSLFNSGIKSNISQSMRSKIVTETFGGIKDLKLLGREMDYMSLYSAPSFEFAKNEANNRLIAQLPKYALELIVFGGILLIILYFLKMQKNMESILPLLGLYAFAGYRLMPALQRIFEGSTTLRFFKPLLDIIYKDIELSSNDNNSTDASHKTDHKIIIKDSLKLKNLFYTYPESKTPVIKNIDLTIRPNTTIGFVGATGSGKTTLIDIILGLLPLERGEMLIDEKLINQINLREWQKNIGYVPQYIYLSDDTIKRNIAFGLPDHAINTDNVIKAAKVARIHDFISNELLDGYETIIGERGVRLSGGQRQRIGIARALYHNPCVLIMDEATSALDSATENIIMDAIHRLSSEKTIMMIAHRITTVRQCDYIYLLEKGQIIASGTYAELMKSSKKFRDIAQSSVTTRKNYHKDSREN
jgi:ABC-type multidrug transport system fused ATPase/permease subunit